MKDGRPVLRDWRGQVIDIGTPVIWRSGSTYMGVWGIGQVTAIGEVADPLLGTDRWALDIAWEQRSYGDARKTSGLKPCNVTVWPGGGS